MMTDAILTAEIEKRLKQTAKILEPSGYEVIETGIPQARRAPEVWAELVGTELLQSAMPVWAAQLGASGKQHIEMMSGICALGDGVNRYIRSSRERRSIASGPKMTEVERRGGHARNRGKNKRYVPSIGRLYTQTMELFDKMRNVMWVNLLSLPSIALPTGIQIVATTLSGEGSVRGRRDRRERDWSDFDCQSGLQRISSKSAAILATVRLVKERYTSDEFFILKLALCIRPISDHHQPMDQTSPIRMIGLTVRPCLAVACRFVDPIERIHFRELVEGKTTLQVQINAVAG